MRSVTDKRKSNTNRTTYAKAGKMAALTAVILAFLLAGILAGCGEGEPETQGQTDQSALSQQIEEDLQFDVSDLTFQGDPYVEINNNKPTFRKELKNTESFEAYGPLDGKGRCTYAIGNLSQETAPRKNEERGDISMIHPSGWKSRQGWERCHLIAWMLGDESANESNLITGTHYFNSDGMLPFEVMVAGYISYSGNHVLYEVIPVFEGKNMIASGVHMMAESVEDNGEGISFNIYCFNVSPGQAINYITGAVTNGNPPGTGDYQQSRSNDERTYVLNTNSKKFHYPSCTGVWDIAEHNKKEVVTSRDKLIQKGYEPCGQCEP